MKSVLQLSEAAVVILLQLRALLIVLQLRELLPNLHQRRTDVSRLACRLGRREVTDGPQVGLRMLHGCAAIGAVLQDELL